jgi:hypothetical protein
MRRDVLACLFFTAAAIGAAAAIIFSHPNTDSVLWLVVGASSGAVSIARSVARDKRRRESGARPAVDRKRVRALSTFTGGLTVFLTAVLPRQPWFAIFAFALIGSVVAAVYYAWCLISGTRY